MPRYLVRRLLLDPTATSSRRCCRRRTAEVGDASCRRPATRLAEAGCPVPGVETEARYDWVRRVLDGVVTRAGRVPSRPPPTGSTAC